MGYILWIFFKKLSLARVYGMHTTDKIAARNKQPVNLEKIPVNPSNMVHALYINKHACRRIIKFCQMNRLTALYDSHFSRNNAVKIQILIKKLNTSGAS